MAEPEAPATRAVPAELEGRTMHVFISRALQKILREASKKQTALRQSCTEVIEELSSSAAGADIDPAMPSPQDPVPAAFTAPASDGPEQGVDEIACAGGDAAAGAISPVSVPDDGTADLDKRLAAMDMEDPVPGTDRYFVPLRLACESKVPKIMEVALHCIQKIIAYGYVRGKILQVDGAPKLMMEVVMETICACKDEEDKDVQLQIVQAVNTAVTSSVASVHDTTLLLAVKTCFYIYLVSKNATIQKTANATLTQMLDVVFARLESSGASSMAQKDAFLVFRSLCKLSMKPLPEPLPSDDSIELRSKLLSLQLLYSIILNSGPSFRSGEKFIWAIRQYLCLSLLKNGVSTIPSILQLSLDIFVTMVKYFKEHLKSEIGVFFSNILLRILESSNSSGQQKQLTIQALQMLVAEPQLMVDLFLNYDCDLEGKGIFTSMCDSLSRLTLTIQALSETTEQDALLKQLALQTLVLIADSMVQWEREVGRDQPQVTTPSGEDGGKAEGGKAESAVDSVDGVGEASDERGEAKGALVATSRASGVALPPLPPLSPLLPRVGRMVAATFPFLLLSLLPSSSRPSVWSPRLARAPLTLQLSAGLAPQLDLVGDGGVLKRIEREGEGISPPRGSTVTVHYEGRLAVSGERFDSSRDRGKPFKFTLGEGKVIGGWEVAVGAMAKGERASITCSPQYAYGKKGIPPLIPPDATLVFDVELIDFEAPQSESGTFAADNAGVPRTPADIQRAYEDRLASQPAKKEGLEAAIEWLKGVYIFGFFSGKEERPPWYLNPLLTFPSIFAIVGVGFWLVVALGGVHRGEVAPIGDDLASFIDVDELKL